VASEHEMLLCMSLRFAALRPTAVRSRSVRQPTQGLSVSARHAPPERAWANSCRAFTPKREQRAFWGPRPNGAGLWRVKDPRGFRLHFRNGAEKNENLTADDTDGTDLRSNKKPFTAKGAKGAKDAAKSTTESQGTGFPNEG
jgi:hypothetical protein